jgi:GDP-mannose 6-dehydrogenase
LSTPDRVSVFGLGYVGCVSAACLAQLGHRVIGVDRDEHKAREVCAGRAPFYEPGLGDLVRDNVASGRLSATVSTSDALRQTDIALVCVGTPSKKDGDLDLEQIRRVAADIATCLAKDPHPLVVAIRSTVFPGTCEEIVRPEFAAIQNVSVVSNPEFLREGCAVRDFMEPSLLVIGGDRTDGVDRVGALYASLPVTACRVALRTAEMIKYACNAFHAVKIGFANEIGTLCNELGVDGAEVMSTVCRDEKLNVSAAYLKPGFAFGGSCLPKDLRAIEFRARRLSVDLPMLQSVLPGNRRHLDRAIDRVLALDGKIGVIGLAFKENTDDLRESPVVTLLEQLIGKGREVRVWDPHIRLNDIYGSNRAFLLNALPHISRLLETGIQPVLDWASHLVLTQNPSPETAAQIVACGLPVTDLSRG